MKCRALPFTRKDKKIIYHSLMNGTGNKTH